MKRRSFLQWLGYIGAAVIAEPVIFPRAELAPISKADAAKVYSEHLHSAVFHTKTVSLEEAREMYPVYRDLQWTDEELAALRAECAGPLVINMIKPSFTIGPGRSRGA